MKYKAIVLDMDGTLLNSNHVISPNTKAALMKAQALGMKVILASGRPTPGMRYYSNELELTENNSYLISYNGGKITELSTNETIFEQTLSKDEVKLMIEKSKEYGINIITYENDTIITSNVDKYIEYEAKLNQIDIRIVDNLYSYVNFPCIKCLMTGDKEHLIEVEKQIKAELPQFIFSRSLPFFLEGTPMGVDKAKTLDRLLKKLDINADEVIACGDGNNDLSMIKYAGLGVAMGNATELVKSNADYITLTNDEDGIVHVLEKFAF